MTGKKRALKSNFAKVDAYRLKASDYDDAPELSDEQLKKAAIKRGRPKIENPKEAITLRVSPDTIKRFRAKGDDWRARMAKALEKAKA